MTLSETRFSVRPSQRGRHREETVLRNAPSRAGVSMVSTLQPARSPLLIEPGRLEHPTDPRPGRRERRPVQSNAPLWMPGRAHTTRRRRTLSAVAGVGS